MSALVVGADGTKGGWIAVALSDGRFESAAFHASVRDITEAHADAAVVALDIPIGELASASRAADAEARKFLPGRASSVFSTPVYAALQSDDYKAARRISVELTGKSLSKQSWELRDKIIEATEAARDDERIIEVHPEVSFTALNGRQPLPRKKSYNGLARRLQLLRDAGIELPPLIDCGDTAPADDVLDAAAAAWTAERKRTGQAASLPSEIVDFAIWY